MDKRKPHRIIVALGTLFIVTLGAWKSSYPWLYFAVLWFGLAISCYNDDGSEQDSFTGGVAMGALLVFIAQVIYILLSG